MEVEVSGATATTVRPRNDIGQYDDLAAEWWKPRGAFAMLHWIAAARAAQVPAATRAGSVLLDIGCGGGVLAPHVAAKGHRHVGVDLSPAALALARDRGITVARADAARLPFQDAVADVVVAGELLEHVEDSAGVVAEAIRVLRPGGTLVIDTIAATTWGRLSAISLGERIPGGPPRRLHDARLFLDRDRLRAQCAEHGVALTLVGLRPSVPGYVAWLLRLRADAPMVATWSTAGLFQAYGVKR
jgi:2-polyprenyl-6-hydroxyphenyl methylase/3-demethylubiquinone-9 3-methyltransferase